VSEGVYVSEKRRARKRRRFAGILAGVVAVVGAGSYAAIGWLDDPAVRGDAGALVPIVSEPPAPAPEPSTYRRSAPPVPVPGLGPATKSAARQSSRPSPVPSLVPSPSARTDEEVASAQVSQLLEPRPDTGVGAAGTRVSVRNERTPDGANVRLVSARYDLTGRWSLLWAADQGRPVGGARCTQNFRTDDQPAGQMRPGLLLCWRTSVGKSVVAVATGRPQEAYSVAIINREWANLG
jgi:hypothetical protein